MGLGNSNLTEKSDAKGWRVVRIFLENEEVALSQLVGLEAEVEKFEPQALRRRLGAVAERMVRLNGSARFRINLHEVRNDQLGVPERSPPVGLGRFVVSSFRGQSLER